MQTEPASSGPADTPEPQPPFDLILLDAGHNKISVIKEVRGITELGLKEAKELCESGGVVLKDVPDLDLIKPVAGQLTALGATVEVRPSEGAAVDIGPVADGGPTGMPAIVCRGCQERGGVHQGRERQWRDKTKKGLFFGSGVIKSEVEYWCSRCGYSWSEELGSRFGGLLG